MLNIRMQSQDTRLRPKITVIGVGGAGGNAVNNMINSGLEGCEFLVCNTDAQALENSIAPQKIQLGPHVTRGLGAGANPEIGAAAAEESIDEILSYLDGSNMVFVTAGMGGGTGTGAAAVIARAAREKGVLTVGVVTKPFQFEGTHRMKLAENGIEDMQQYVDTLIVIPNQNLFRIATEKTTFADAFCMADEVLQSGVRGVTDLMVMPGLINLDFADIRAVMAEMGKAMMGTGESESDNRAIEAAEAAISNPLLDDISMKGARGVLINITGGNDMTLFEVDEAANRIRDEVDPDANIIFGSTFDESLSGRMRVSVVATGIDAELQKSHLKPGRTQAAPHYVQKTAATEKEKAESENTQERPATENFAQTENAAPSYTTRPSPLPQTAGFRNDIPKLPASLAAAPSASPYQATASAAPQKETATQAPAQTAGHAAGVQDWGQNTAAAVKLDAEDVLDATQTQPRTPVSQKRATPESEWPQPQRSPCGNRFIPPKPVDPRSLTEEDAFLPEQPSAPAPEKTAATAEKPQTALTAEKPQTAPQKPAAPAAEKPSFFERLTGQKKSAPQTATPQKPDAKKADDDELDIPAFLRRQAN